MSEIEVRAFECLSVSPGIELALLGQLELTNKGFGPWLHDIRGEHPCLVALAANGRDIVPAGVMTWEAMSDDGNYINIRLSFVLQEFRGRGVYTAMWTKIVEIGRGLGVRSIWSDTHVRNQAMRAIASRQGRTEEYVQLRFDIPR